MDMSHEAAKDEAFTILYRCRRRLVRGCRIVIQVPVSATQGANRADPVENKTYASIGGEVGRVLSTHIGRLTPLRPTVIFDAVPSGNFFAAEVNTFAPGLSSAVLAGA
jgi:hypothetical protein